MSRDLVSIENDMHQLDIRKIADYSRKVSDIGSISKMMVPLYLRDFIIGYDITSSMLAQAIRYELECKAVLEEKKSIAFLDRAGSYFEKINMKDSATARDRYVDMDSDVVAAKELYAKSTALVCLLKNKIIEFKMAHDSLKKCTYDNSDSSYEGM